MYCRLVHFHHFCWVQNSAHSECDRQWVCWHGSVFRWYHGYAAGVERLQSSSSRLGAPAEPHSRRLCPALLVCTGPPTTSMPLHLFVILQLVARLHWSEMQRSLTHAVPALQQQQQHLTCAMTGAQQVCGSDMRG
jgi:hypothetical protein